jgi:DNA-binding LacI/PurR family transcriptional regulator
MNIHHVARKLRISVATVSRALNPATEHLVAEKTRRRVHKFAQQIGYVPNRTARELSTGKTRTIGLLLPNVLESLFFNDHLIKVLAGVYRVLDERNAYNCKIIILPKGKVLTDLDHQVLTSGLDGLLLSPYSDPALYGAQFPKSLLRHWKHPVVVLNLNTNRLRRFSGVYQDQRDAARKAVTYLIQKGHRDIGMITGDPAFPEAIERYEGYRQALEEHGLTVRQSALGAGNFLAESGYNVTLGLLRGPRKPTALFCANDEMAMGALRAISALRLRCPQDVAVMGFDGLDLGEYLQPRLTSLSQPMREVAETATRLLLDLVEGTVDGPVVRTVASHIIVRESA